LRKESFAIANMKFINIFASCKNLIRKRIVLLLLNMVKDYDQIEKNPPMKIKRGHHLRFDHLISKNIHLPQT